MTPTWSADADCEDGKEPRVNLADPSEDCKEGGPNTNEEDGDQDEDLPVLELAVPQE